MTKQKSKAKEIAENSGLGIGSNRAVLEQDIKDLLKQYRDACIEKIEKIDLKKTAKKFAYEKRNAQLATKHTAWENGFINGFNKAIEILNKKAEDYDN